MEILHASQGRWTSLAPQIVSSKCLDVLKSCPKDELHQWFLGCTGAHHSRHGSPLNPCVATIRSHLALYAASHRYCGGPLQPFRRGHSARPDFLQPLWGTSLEDFWNHGIERNSQFMRALTCSHSLSRGVEDLFGRVPLIPCFLGGNATSTIPHKYSNQQKDAFEYCCADGAGPTSRRGSHVYEINTWLWNFGRPQPRVGGLSVAKTESSDGSPGPRLPSADGQLRGLASDLCMVYT